VTVVDVHHDAVHVLTAHLNNRHCLTISIFAYRDLAVRRDGATYEQDRAHGEGRNNAQPPPHGGDRIARTPGTW
jgi:hypothetical protein